MDWKKWNGLLDIRQHLLEKELDSNKKWVEEYIEKIDKELDDMKNEYLVTGDYQI